MQKEEEEEEEKKKKKTGGFEKSEVWNSRSLIRVHGVVFTFLSDFKYN